MEDTLQRLLAADTNIPPETVPTMLKELEKLQSSMRQVDNHLLIIARSMVERKRLVDRQLRAERRAQLFYRALGALGRTAKAVGGTAVRIVTLPVRAVRTHCVKSIDAPKPRKQRRAKKAKPAPGMVSVHS